MGLGRHGTVLIAYRQFQIPQLQVSRRARTLGLRRHEERKPLRGRQAKEGDRLHYDSSLPNLV